MRFKALAAHLDGINADVQQQSDDARFDPDHHEPRVGRDLRQRGVGSEDLRLAAAVAQSRSERFSAHQFAQPGLVLQAHLERGVLGVEGAAGAADDGVALSDGREIEKDEGCRDQEDSRHDHPEVARERHEYGVPGERHGQRAARSRDQHAVARRGGHRQQINLHPRVAVVECGDREDHHRQPHAGAEIRGVAVEREVAHAGVDDVGRGASID